jgi:MHS family alpha-ketoglutarate permease-like MFS transporter
MAAWGWRVPFAIGACGGLFALFMRMRMKETEPFVREAAAAKATPGPGVWREIWAHRRSAAQVVGMTVGLTVVYYFWVVAASAYSIAVLAADATQVLVAGLLANLTFLVWLPMWGSLSDRIGRKPVMYIGVLGSIAVAYPLTALIDGDAVHLFLAMTVRGADFHLRAVRHQPGDHV